MQNTAQQGNAMIYILIALALFGFLTMTMTRQANQSDGQDLNDEQIALYADSIMGYTSAVQLAIDMMIDTGSTVGDLDFVIPSDAAFDTPPHIHKVFHPQGGGVNYQENFNESIQTDATSAWDVNNVINVEWTKTTASDAILTAYFISRPICEHLNKLITEETTIPVTANAHADYFLSTGTTNFNTTECADCEGYPSLCVENNTNDNYSFYSIIAAQ